MPRRLASPQSSRDPEGWDEVITEEDDEVEGVTWTPTAKQAEYLAASEMEVLYGGAAGGGKTDALVIDAMGLWQQAVLQPDYRAIVFRPTFPELRALEARMQEIYPLAYPGADFNKTDHIWKFPSGAEISTSYMQTEDDRYRWQSFEFQFVGFEELTQWPTDVCYTYLFSRLRTSNPALRCMMRANCNPGGRGHKWVRDRWGIKDDGSATLSKLIVTLGDGSQRTIGRRFIPARLSDNPYLGPDYEANLLLLDEMTRRALLSGRWDVIEIPGAIYKKEMEAAFFEGRITRIPYDPALPVHTIWDLGMGDSTAIWFVQHVGIERRAIDYHEAAGEGLQYYARVLAEKRYVYGQHFAPHDIAVRELGTGKSRLEVAANLGIHFQIAPNLPVDEGIHACRVFLPTVYFDGEKCQRGIECLTNYRRKYNEKLGEFSITPEHDWASHGCFVGETAVLTPYGTYEIMRLPKNGKVITQCGIRQYDGPHLTQKNAPLVAVTFADGSTVKCTPGHKFLTANGWKSAGSLAPGSVIQSIWTQSPSISTESCIASIPATDTTVRAGGDCIAGSGKRHLDRCRQNITYTIGTITRRIMRWAISNACPVPNIWQKPAGAGAETGTLRLATSPANAPATGINPTRAGYGIAGTRGEQAAGQNGPIKNSRAGPAGTNSTRCNGQPRISTAEVHAEYRRSAGVSERQNWALRLRSALSKNGAQSTYQSAEDREDRTENLIVKSVVALTETADVWDITVPGIGCFALGNGAIVHNSDSARYWALSSQYITNQLIGWGDKLNYPKLTAA